MDRRDVLVGTGLLVSSALAGCPGNDDGPDEPTEEIVRFFVTNEDEVRRLIRIDIEADGERQASGIGEVPPAGEQDEPFRYGFPSIGTAVSAVIQSDDGSRSMQWDPTECSELHVDVRIRAGEPDVQEDCQ